MKKILIFLVMILGGISFGLFLYFYYPEKWTVPYWFSLIPPITLFWRRIFLFFYILTVSFLSFWFTRDKKGVS